MNAFEAPKYLATIGGGLGLARWWKSNKSKALEHLQSISKILLLDANLKNKDLIPIGVPLVYSIIHGTAMGSIIGFLVDWLHNVMHRSSYLPQEIFLYSALSSILSLLIIRIFLEFIYKGK